MLLTERGVQGASYHYQDEFAELVMAVCDVVSEDVKLEDVVFFCIGTDRVTGDSFGPFVGTLLERKGYTNVCGTLENPVTAVNLKERAGALPVDKIVIAVDAFLGAATSVGKLGVWKGSLKPGAGLGRELGEVGDYNIRGIVNVVGGDYSVFSTTKMHIVYTMAEAAVEVLCHRFPLKTNTANSSTERVV